MLAGLGVVCGIFSRLAPRTGDAEIVPLVGAAAFERNDVLDDPVVGWPELSSAFAAASVTLKKQLRRLLF